MCVRHPIPNPTQSTLIEPPRGIKTHGMLMDSVFEGHGIRFEYPDDWILHEQSTPEEITLTVHSPDTCFWSVTLLLDRPEPQRVIESALDAFREEYTEIDVYSGDERLNELPTIACELDFVCHDLISSAFLRAIVAANFTVLVLYQGADLELDTLQTLLEKITASLKWEIDSDDPPGELEWMNIV